MDTLSVPIIGVSSFLLFLVVYLAFRHNKTCDHYRVGWILSAVFAAMGVGIIVVLWRAIFDPVLFHPAPMAAWLGLGAAVGLLFGMLGFIRLLQEKRKNDLNLRESEWFLERAQQAARLGSFHLDVRTGVWDCSGLMFEILGIDDSYRYDLQGWLQRVHPDQRTEMRDYFLKEVIGKRRPFDRDFRILRANDGQVRWVHGTGVLDLERDGKPVRMVGTLQDITERKNAESALKESEQRFRSLAESLPQAVFETDHLGNLVYANRSAHEMFGYESGLLGQGLGAFDLVAPLDRPRALQHLRRILEGNVRTKGNEYTGLRKDGTTFPLIVYTNFKRQDDRMTGAIGMVLDATEAKRGEVERHQLQVQFFQAQKMESIGTLAGGIAHDFNNMLGGILGSLSIMELRKEMDSELHREIVEMKALVKRGAGMTRQLLSFARRGKHEAKALDLIDVIEKTLKLYNRTRKDVMIRTEFLGDAVHVLGDPSQVEQVMMNLFVNAGQAMPDGGVLAVRVEKAEPTAEAREPLGIPPGLFAKVMVQDTGVGMDQPTLDRIFEPFFTTKGAGTGTGLGLASVYGIVKTHGGFVRVDSHPGEGATFTVYLPLTEEIPLAEGDPESCPVWFGEDVQHSVLLVDDEEPILRTCTKTLQTIGFNVHPARNGREALEIFKERKGHLSVVILDMVMPGLTGLETFEAMKALDPKVKVLLASGYSREGHAAMALEPGNHAFIEKPFDIEALSAKLKELI